MMAKGPRWQERGVELVEMAFVLPLLMVLLLGIIAFGRAYDVYQTITRAAREGAREAVLTGCATCADPTTVPSATDVQNNFVNPALQAANLDPSLVENYSQVTCTLDPADNPPQVGISISFQYPYQIVLPFTGLNLTTIHIPTDVRMRLENQPTGTPPASCP